MRKLAALVPALLLAAPLCAQAHSENNLDVYYMSSGIELEVPQGGTRDGSGDGFGVKGQFSFAPGLYFTGEYQSTNIDEFNGFEEDADLDQMRLGLGGSAQIGRDLWGRLQVEYVDLEFRDEEFDDGFGMHAGLVFDVDFFSFYGDIGYLMLGDADGPEFLIGAAVELLPSLGVFADYRLTSLEIDNGFDDKFEFDDFRIGMRLSF